MAIKLDMGFCCLAHSHKRSCRLVDHRTHTSPRQSRHRLILRFIAHACVNRSRINSHIWINVFIVNQHNSSLHFNFCFFLNTSKESPSAAQHPLLPRKLSDVHSACIGKTLVGSVIWATHVVRHFGGECWLVDGRHYMQVCGKLKSFEQLYDVFTHVTINFWASKM